VPETANGQNEVYAVYLQQKKAVSY